MTVEQFVQKHGVKVRQNRGGWITSCLYPDHRDSTPSFHINWQGLFMCWGCGKKGSFATLLHDIEKWSWRKAIEHADLLNKTRPTRDPMEWMAKPSTSEMHISRGLLGLFDVNWREGFERYLLEIEKYQSEGMDGLDTAALYNFPPWTFPFRKGFTAKTLEHFQAGYDEDLLRVTIPIFSEEKLCGFMGRTCIDAFPKYYIYSPLKPSLHLYNVESVLAYPPRGDIIVVEGAWDVWMLHEKGITIPAVSLLTSKISSQQANQLAGLNRTCVLMFDGDRAGREGALSVARALVALGVKVDIGMSYKKGVTDIKQMPSGDIWVAYAQRKRFPAPSAFDMLGVR